jgi:hypothetical protein
MSEELLRVQILLNQVLCLPTQADKEEINIDFGEVDGSNSAEEVM